MQPTLKKWLTRKPSGPKPKKGLRRSGRVRPMSKKRARLAKAYRLLRGAFLRVHTHCQAWRHIVTAYPQANLPDVCPIATDIHHKAGRLNGNYLNTDTWLAVSRDSHRWIHDNPGKARALGLLY
jgi:hypothetical protein